MMGRNDDGSYGNQLLRFSAAQFYSVSGRVGCSLGAVQRGSGANGADPAGNDGGAQ